MQPLRNELELVLGRDGIADVHHAPTRPAGLGDGAGEARDLVEPDDPGERVGIDAIGLVPREARMGHVGPVGHRAVAEARGGDHEATVRVGRLLAGRTTTAAAGDDEGEGGGREGRQESAARDLHAGSFRAAATIARAGRRLKMSPCEVRHY